jgi:hypothetical protein
VELLKLLINGYRPVIEIAFFDEKGRELRREKAAAEAVKLDEFDYRLVARARGSAGTARAEVVLLDASGQVLFRKRVGGRFEGEVEVDWYIGIPREPK